MDLQVLRRAVKKTNHNWYSRIWYTWTRVQRKINFTACHSGKLKLAFTSPKNFFTSRIDFTVLLLFKFLKKYHLYPSGKLKIEFISPIAKSTSPGLSNTTFIACWPEQAFVIKHYRYSLALIPYPTPLPFFLLTSSYAIPTIREGRQRPFRDLWE